MSKRTYVIKEPIRYGEYEGHRYPVYEIRDGVEITAPIFPEHYIDTTPLPWWAKNTTLRWRMLKYRIRHNRRVVIALAKLHRQRTIR